MNKFQPFRYLKKYTSVIVAIFLLLTVALFVVLKAIQSYTATVVIDYAYDGAENGLAPDNTELKVSDIYSSNVVSQAIHNLGWDEKDYPIDEVCQAIQVVKVEDDSVTAVNEALNEEGETSDLQPTKYEVSYKVKSTMNSKEAKAAAQELLEEILDVYFTEFSKNYINTVSVVNSTSTLNQGSYDYIEQVEILDTALSETIDNLEDRATTSPGFYSPQTGYSFSELANQFSLLYETKITQLYSYILRHRVTKDQNTLLNRYAERMQQDRQDQVQYAARVSEVEGIITAYVEKLRASNNTAQSGLSLNGSLVQNGNVLGDVESPNYNSQDDEWVAYDQTTEYELLLQDWIDLSDQYNESIVDERYSQYIISCFSGNDEATIAYQQEVGQITNQSGENAEIAVSHEAVVADAIQQELSAGVYVEGTLPCTQQDVEYVQNLIAEVIQDANALYDLVAQSDQEYNEYLGAQYIQIFTSSYVTENVNVLLYTAIGAILFLGIGCFGVIIIGRAGDMIEYIAFTDHLYRMPNRVACDRFIQKNKDKILPVGFACIVFQVEDIDRLNQKLGRNGGDALLCRFAEILKSLLTEKKDFAGYNGGGMFMLFAHDVERAELNTELDNVRALMDEAARQADVTFRYAVGSEIASENGQRKIRELIGAASRQKEDQDVGSTN